jgi:hypothetical protein
MAGRNAYATWWPFFIFREGDCISNRTAQAATCYGYGEREFRLCFQHSYVKLW